MNSVCEVERTVHQLKEGPWTWKNQLRMKAAERCEYQHGQSGTAGIIDGENVIYALAQTMYEGGEACSFNNACEVDATGNVSAGANLQPYAVPVKPLYGCYDETTARFDFNLATCDLNFKKPQAHRDDKML